MLRYTLFILCAISALTSSAFTAEIDPATRAIKHIVRIRGGELTPKVITLNKIDGSVFFYNESDNEPVHLSIDFGTARVHCHSSNLIVDKNGKMKTRSPIIPGSFVIACFPEPDRYSFQITSASGKLRSNGAVIARKIQE